jgi:hypothetical protein
LVRDLAQYSILAGANKTQILAFNVDLPDNATEDSEIVLAFGFTQFLIPDVLNATLNGSPLKIRRTYPLGLDLDELETSKIFIRSMARKLKERQRLQQAKSDFESYLYGLKNRIENDDFFRRALTNSEKGNLTVAVETQLRWFEADTNITSASIADHHAAVKTIARVVEVRAEQLKKRPLAMKKLNSTLGTVHMLLNVTWRIWKNWIPKNKTEPVWRLYNSTKEWYDEQAKLFEMAHDWDDPVVIDKEIDQKSSALERLAKRVNATEKPRPTPQPRAKKAANTTHTNRTAVNITEVNQTDVNEIEGNETASSEDGVKDQENSPDGVKDQENPPDGVKDQENPPDEPPVVERNNPSQAGSDESDL